MLQTTQICIGRFHHFHLARELVKAGLFKEIWTSYPPFALRNEQDIPKHLIHSHPWIYSFNLLLRNIGLTHIGGTISGLNWVSFESLDKKVASTIQSPTIVVALSGTGLYSGLKAQSLGGRFICDRGSSHIQYQQDILQDEYRRWKIPYPKIDTRIVAKEESEYEKCDLITVPSSFAKKSFIEKGISESKLRQVPYGISTAQFHKIADAPKDIFRVLWVGSVSLRKGFPYALEAFLRLKHPNKEFLVAGAIHPDLRSWIMGRSDASVRYLGSVRHSKLIRYYSTSHVLALPSIEDGFGLVQTEALACGCPVIASTNTGAPDFITDGVHGFIVPIRSSDTILQCFQKLVDEPQLHGELSQNAVDLATNTVTWGLYGKRYSEVIQSLQ